MNLVIHRANLCMMNDELFLCSELKGFTGLKRTDWESHEFQHFPLKLRITRESVMVTTDDELRHRVRLCLSPPRAWTAPRPRPAKAKRKECRNNAKPRERRMQHFWTNFSSSFWLALDFLGSLGSAFFFIWDASITTSTGLNSKPRCLVYLYRLLSLLFIDLSIYRCIDLSWCKCFMDLQCQVFHSITQSRASGRR